MSDEQAIRQSVWTTAIRITRGCSDYLGGYPGDPALLSAFHHGIGTVQYALEDAAKADTERGGNLQLAALHAMGRATDVWLEKQREIDGLRRAAKAQRAENEELRARAWIAGVPGVEAPPEAQHLRAYRDTDGVGRPREVWWTQSPSVTSLWWRWLRLLPDGTIRCAGNVAQVYGEAPTWRELMQIPAVRAAMGVPHE